MREVEVLEETEDEMENEMDEAMGEDKKIYLNEL